MLNSWMFAFLFSLRYTSLKGRAGLVQAVFIGGTASIVMAIVLGAAWLNAH